MTLISKLYDEKFHKTKENEEWFEGIEFRTFKKLLIIVVMRVK